MEVLEQGFDIPRRCVEGRSEFFSRQAFLIKHQWAEYDLPSSILHAYQAWKDDQYMHFPLTTSQ